MCYYNLTICTECGRKEYAQVTCSPDIHLVTHYQAAQAGHLVCLQENKDATLKVCNTCNDLMLCAKMEQVELKEEKEYVNMEQEEGMDEYEMVFGAPEEVVSAAPEKEEELLTEQPTEEDEEMDTSQ